MNMIELQRVADLVTSETWARLKAHGRPSSVGGVEPPQDLFGLTFGELIKAQRIAEQNDVKAMCELLLGFSEAQYERADAGEVMAFAYWVAKELEAIGKLFQSLNVKPTPEQIKAGIKELDFGLFGTLDWFCLRMGITHHDKAEDIPWVRFYECMKNDNKRAKYEQNLRKIYEQQSKQKRTSKR